MEKSKVNEACSAYVDPRSDLHKYVYYRRRVLMLNYELESCTVSVIFSPLEFGNTKPKLGSVIIRTSKNTPISMLCHFSSVFCEENFPRCRHFKCLACPPKRSQKTLRVKFVPRFPIVSGVGNSCHLL